MYGEMAYITDISIRRFMREPPHSHTARVEARIAPREAQERFVSLLLDPPPPSAALRRALKRHKSLIAG